MQKSVQTLLLKHQPSFSVRVLYNFNLWKFNAPVEAILAIIEVKTCIDTISFLGRLQIKAVTVISSFCRGFCSESQPGGRSACCSVGAQDGEAAARLLPSDRVASGHREDGTAHLLSYTKAIQSVWGCFFFLSRLPGYQVPQVS